MRRGNIALAVIFMIMVIAAAIVIVPVLAGCRRYVDDDLTRITCRGYSPETYSWAELTEKP